ncbi:MAG: YeeE/YedE thiosulfate transporter family protein [Guyparkeria sp.]
MLSRRNLLFLAFGIGFGFLLSRAGATSPAIISDLLLFEDLRLLWVIATAVALGGALTWIAARRGWRARNTGKPITIRHKPFKRGLIVGSVLFGLGWAATGVGPGTALAMIGEGKGFALWVGAGIVLGAGAGSAINRRLERG